MAALEHLVDTARENADADILRYNAVLRQTKGLAENPVLQRVLLKLLGSKEEIAIAKGDWQSYKKLPSSPLLLRGFQSSAQHSFTRAQPYSFSSGRANGIICFACGRPGHIARNCRGKKGRYCSAVLFVLACNSWKDKPINAVCFFRSQKLSFSFFVLFSSPICRSLFPSSHQSRSQAGFSYYNPFPGFLARLRCGSSFHCVPSSSAIYLLIPSRFPSPRFFSARIIEATSHPSSEF